MMLLFVVDAFYAGGCDVGQDPSSVHSYVQSVICFPKEILVMSIEKMLANVRTTGRLSIILIVTLTTFCSRRLFSPR
jgi:hypothetical protein